jgi:hypothetical protein
MSLVIDTLKPGIANFMDMLNVSNASTILLHQVSFSELTKFSPEQVDAFGRNTSVRIKAVDNHGYINGPTAENGVVVNWRRLTQLEAQGPGAVSSMDVDNNITWASLNGLILYTNGILASDVYNENQYWAGLPDHAIVKNTIEMTGPDTAVVTFRPIGNSKYGAASVSHVYADGAYSVTLRFVTYLDDIIQNHNLDGFVPDA